MSERVVRGAPATKPGREVAKEVRAMIEALLEQGWTYHLPAKGHPVLLPADKAFAPITMAGTPSDHRAFKNLRAQIRRSGGEV